MPAARAFGVAGVIAVLLVGAVVVPWMGLIALAVDVLLVFAIWFDARRAALVPLEAQRAMPLMLAQGAPGEITVRISNLCSRAVRLEAREALAPALAEWPIRQSFSIPASETVAWSYRLVPRRRGEALMGPLTVRVLGPWGLGWAERDLIPAAPRRVYPQIRWEGRVGRLLALARRRELGQSPLPTTGIGREPYALRDYRPGDPLSRIHWKASARHSRLIAREDTWERGRPLIILLDCARAMVSLDRTLSKLDHALAATLALTRVALGRGDRVTVIAFSSVVERLVRVHAGANGAARAYGALFDLEARLAEPAYDAAAETVLRSESRRSTVVLFTSVIDLAAAELLRESLVQLRRRHRVVLINLEDPDLVALALCAPDRVEEAFGKVAALEVLLGNRRLGRGLRRGGIHVVTTAADRLAWKSLEAYLNPSLVAMERNRGSRVAVDRSSAR